MAGCIARLSSSIPRFSSCIVRSNSLTVPVLRKKRIQRKLCHLQQFSTALPTQKKETVTVYFVQEDGTKSPAKAKVGDNLLDIVIENDIDIDGYGACEGTLACSTCHLIFQKADYDKIEEKPTDEELDMLDLAYGLTDTSRLGCQVIVTKEMDGLVVRVPAGVADAREPS